MLNHAFLIMVHKSPELLCRIIHLLAKENHYFFIHIDKRSKKNFTKFIETINDVKNIIFIPSECIYHGSVTQIYCELFLFKFALNYTVKMDYFHLISGQDYPLRSNECFDSFFERYNGYSFACIEGDAYHEQKMKKEYILRTQLYHPNKPSKFKLLF